MTGQGETAYRRKRDESGWYASPMYSWNHPTNVVERGYTSNPNSARDQRRWDATVTSKKVRSSASNARKGKKTK